VLVQLVEVVVAVAQPLVQEVLALLVKVLPVDLELNKLVVILVVVEVAVPAALVEVAVAIIMALTAAALV
jgi:hypothetical protein